MIRQFFILLRNQLIPGIAIPGIAIPGIAISGKSLIGILLSGLLSPSIALAQDPMGLVAITSQANANGGETYSLSLQALILMTVLTLLPAFLLMMTSFTRIIIVLSILRQALGTTGSPSNQILLGLALFLTFFVMNPVYEQIHEIAVVPLLDQQIDMADAITQATGPVKDFMLHQTRESDLSLFLDIADIEVDDVDQIPLTVLMPAFVTSELKTAFQIGFLLFIPFLIIDLIVASVLMSMGMMMLSPLIISLPFKLLLFVLIDGWTLIMGTLASSFYL